MRGRSLRAPVASLALVLIGCASPDPLALKPRSGLTADDYGEVLDQWTRHDEVYDALESVMFVHATFHSPEFRKVFLLRFPDVYGPGSDEARRLALTDPSAELFHEFFVSASTSDIRWNDFAKGDESIWRISLVGEDGESVAGEVERVKPTANIQRIYPYITHFARTYLVRFPLTGVNGEPIITRSTSSVRLRIASALGTAEMEWALAPH